MTTAQLDHLNRIKLHLETLLAKAEKRTQGEWCCPNTRTEVFMTDSRMVAICYGPEATAHGNAAFIASCAGNAEAGWRSTLAAINYLEEHTVKWGYFSLGARLIETLLAEWPLETLKA